MVADVISQCSSRCYNRHGDGNGSSCACIVRVRIPRWRDSSGDACAGLGLSAGECTAARRGPPLPAEHALRDFVDGSWLIVNWIGRQVDVLSGCSSRCYIGMWEEKVRFRIPQDCGTTTMRLRIGATTPRAPDNDQPATQQLGLPRPPTTDQ